MNRYEKGKIYKIVSPDFEKCYIGSTTEPLSKRMERHRKLYKTYLETGNVDTRVRLIFDEYGIENCKILLIQNYPCESKEELLRKEGEYIQAMQCVNKCVAGRTPAEYKELYKDYFKQKRQEYYDKNKEYILNRNSEYKQQHKEQIDQRRHEYYEQNKQQINEENKQYYNNNFDKIKQQKAKYADNNKEYLAEKRKEWCNANRGYVKQRSDKYYQEKQDSICAKKKEKVECECGAMVRIHEIKRHQRTNKHQFFLQQKQ